VAEALFDLTGVRVPEDAWDVSALPGHLRMKVRLVDPQGRLLGAGDDLVDLKRRNVSGEASSRPAAGPQWGIALERDGIKRWDFGRLPEYLDSDRGGIRLRGFPALVDQGDSVAIRVLDSDQAAERATRAGLRRLVMLSLAQELRSLRRDLPGLDRMRLQYAKAPRAEEGHTSDMHKPPDLSNELLALILDLTFTEGLPPIREAADFDRRVAERKPLLATTAAEVCALAASILDAYQRLRKRLDGITQINWMPSVLDLRAQLDGLVFRGFLQQVPFEHLKDYPRYLKAADQRAEKLRHAAGRDQERLRALTPLLDRWRERRAAALAAERSDPRLDEIRWMLEELRVSLFAQQLGTAYPVSVKRIEARWCELGL